MALSFNVLRTGNAYRLVNFGVQHDFIIENILPSGDFWVKDLLTLETYRLKELIGYGKGEDFDLVDLPEEE